MSADEYKFRQRVDMSGDCWEWLGTKNQYGYGLTTTNKKAHRFAYELDNGPIPDGMIIDHMCHNRGCVKPAHLRVVTHKQNNENRAGAQVNNTGSGVRGVYKARNGKFQARAQHGGKIYTAGTHDTIAEAEVAAINLRLSLYTHNVIDRNS